MCAVLGRGCLAGSAVSDYVPLLEQTREQEAIEALRRLRHMVDRPDGMTKAELFDEVARVCDRFLFPDRQ